MNQELVTVSANLTHEQVAEIKDYQRTNGIKHFADAVREYVELLRKG